MPGGRSTGCKLVGAAIGVGEQAVDLVTGSLDTVWVADSLGSDCGQRELALTGESGDCEAEDGGNDLELHDGVLIRG